jgi:hypothetical protein
MVPTAFWAMVTVGRRLHIAAIWQWLPRRVVHHLLPALLVATSALTAMLHDAAMIDVAVVATAALGPGLHGAYRLLRSCTPASPSTANWHSGRASDDHRRAASEATVG